MNFKEIRIILYIVGKAVENSLNWYKHRKSFQIQFVERASSL